MTPAPGASAKDRPAKNTRNAFVVLMLLVKRLVNMTPNDSPRIGGHGFSFFFSNE